MHLLKASRTQYNKICTSLAWKSFLVCRCVISFKNCYDFFFKSCKNSTICLLLLHNTSNFDIFREDGVFRKKATLPHTITEWVGSAVCINDEDGLGLSNTTTIKGFQAFFISTNYPYSVIRGESFWITISIFSYVEDPLPVSCKYFI